MPIAMNIFSFSFCFFFYRCINSFKFCISAPCHCRFSCLFLSELSTVRFSLSRFPLKCVFSSLSPLFSLSPLLFAIINCIAGFFLYLFPRSLSFSLCSSFSFPFGSAKFFRFSQCRCERSRAL